MVDGPVYFGDGTGEAVEKAKDEWALAPNGEIILDAFGVLSSGECTFLAARYSFYNMHDRIAFCCGRKRASGVSPACQVWTLFVAN